MRSGTGESRQPDRTSPTPDTPTESGQLMERIVAPENMRSAYQRVMRNKGSAGVDGMTVHELAGHIRAHWPDIQRQLLDGSYQPQAVRQQEIPKPGGGVRTLGIPTVTDRLIQQAMMQVLQAEWDPTFSESSYGFRPGRSAHQAVRRAQEHYRAGYRKVVDLDLEKFFDRVNHNKLMSLVERRVEDVRVRRLILRYLQAGAMRGKVYTTRDEGTPQGGPLSPLLANLLLDELDRELERRGHRFVRYADDCNIYVGSLRSGERVMQSVTRFLERTLKLKVNEAKSKVDRPSRRSFLGFSIGKGGSIHISEKAEKRLKEHIRELTQRTKGRSLRDIVRETAVYLRGWVAYFRLGYHKTRFYELTAWILRRLRCYQWKQWGSRRYRELRQRGVSRELAWNTRKSAHGPWRLSLSPALHYALPTRTFTEMGLPLLHEQEERNRRGT